MNARKRRKILLAIALATVVFLLAYIGIFAITLLSQAEGYLVVEPVTLPPTNSKLMEKIEEFPSVRDAIGRKPYFSTEIPIEDYEEMLEVLKNGSCVKVDGTYYHFTISAFTGIKELNRTEISNLSDLTPVTYEELKNFRPLNLSLYYWKIRDVGESVFTVEANLTEIQAVQKLIEEKGDILEYEGNYFRIFLKARLGFEASIELDKCISLDGKLDNFPLLKRGLIEAEKESRRLREGKHELRKIDNIGEVEAGRVRIRMAVSEMNRIADTFGYFDCVRYNNSFFRIVLAKPMD